jgi:hypothetical protein
MALSIENKARLKFPAILQRSPYVFLKSTCGPVLQILHLSPSVFPKLTVVRDFAVRPEIQKIFTKWSLASGKSPKIAPKLQKFISFQPQLQIQ